MWKEKLINLYLSWKATIKFNLGLVKRNDNLKKRKLTFYEDFTSEKLNKNKWNTEFPWGRHSDNLLWEEEKIQIYNSKANFMIDYDPGTHYGWWGDHKYEYKTAMINTLGKFEQKYGRWECKAKVKNIKGLFPAFWMLTPVWIHSEAPNNKEVIMPEIDIFEHFNRDKNKRIESTYHYGLSYDDGYHKFTGNGIKHTDFTKDFHIYAVEWTEDKLEFSVDEEVFKVLYFKNYKDYDRANKPMYLILNEAVTKEYQKSKNIVGMEVDWVRVYE